jgi:hypothetical protein
VHRLHRERRGTPATIDLIPDLADPKDLYAMIAPPRTARETIAELTEAASA